MAPNRGSSSKGKTSSSSSSGPKKGIVSSGSRVSKPGGGGGSSSSKKRNVKRPPPQEMKSKARTAPEQLRRKKKREYTEAELDLPKLNAITPVGVVKPKGKKKGKTFVDDQEAMMTILAMVNAEKEGQIESKIMKARQLEEIREAKRKEAEARQAERKSKFEDVKASIRQKRKGKGGADHGPSSRDEPPTNGGSSPKARGKGKRKSVAFA